jgi:hypothetical protein
MRLQGPRRIARHIFSLFGQPRTFLLKIARLRWRDGGGLRLQATRWLQVWAVLACAGIGASAAHGAGTLTFSPAAASFGNVTAGSSATVAVTISNTGPESVAITQDMLSANEFTVSGLSLPLSLAAGAHVVMTLKFAPTQTGLAGGHLVIWCNATNGTVSYPVSGTGVAAGSTLTATPNNVPFGNVPLAESGSQSVQLKNPGMKSISISSITESGAGFTTSGLTTPLTLAAGATSVFTVKFAPTEIGTDIGTVAIKYSESSTPLTLSLTGTGIADTRTISASPTSLAFGNEAVGSSKKLAVNLKNTGNSSLTISGLVVAGFDVSIGSGLSGATIAPGQTATLDVTFAPRSAEQLSGSVKVTSNAINSPMTITLSGTGVSASAPSVALTWDASMSAGVVGYNVYRATAPSTTHTKLVSSPVSGLKYMDQTVAAGTTYNYVVTAVNSSGEESAYSVPATVVLP